MCVRVISFQVTTHCPLMTHEELTIVTDAVGMNFAHFDLHEFDSELDFSNKIGYVCHLSLLIPFQLCLIIQPQISLQ